jgi:hypothetical protein
MQWFHPLHLARWQRQGNYPKTQFSSRLFNVSISPEQFSRWHSAFWARLTAGNYQQT